jgi:hypothetical protein
MPLSTIRSANHLTKDLMNGFHPLEVCYYLCPETIFEKTARIALYDERVAAGLAKAGIPAVSDFLKSIDMLKRLSTPPVPEASGSHGYCPRCWRQYRSGFDACVDCNEVKLIPFK